MAEKMLEVKDLKVYFEMKKGFAETLFGKPQVLKAVDGVSFSIGRGEISVSYTHLRAHET